jgi:hypothetical protein
MTLDLGTGNIAGTVNLTNATSGNISLVVQPPSGLTITNATSPGSVKIQSSGGVTIPTSVTVSGGATGTAVTIGAATGVFNLSATATFTAPNGRYLLYLNDPTAAHTYGALAMTGADFKQYDASWTATPAQTTGNGRLYSVSPTLTSSLLGSASKFYDGTTTMDLAGTTFGVLSGYINGDQLGAINGGTGVLASANVGTGIGLTVSGMTLTGVRNSTNAYPVYGYKVASVSANIATVKASAVSSTIQTAGDVVTAFAEKFEVALKDPQEINDVNKETAKDSLLVEAEICRP